jgi:release factor glutamine methyltransferase
MREREWLLREKYGGKTCREFTEDLQRLARGEPLAYVIGWVDFLGTRIALASRPLIPRPETEWWVERVINNLRARPPAHILDLYAGSGCIGIALLNAFLQSKAVFGEIDPTHCEQIRANLRANNIETERGAVIRSDGFTAIEGTFDLIVANPPYLDAQIPQAVEPSVLMYEPHQALFARQSGLEHIAYLLERSAAYLSPDGMLVIEIGEEQSDAVSRTATELAWTSTIHPDQYGKPRWGVFVRSKRTSSVL